MPAGQYAVSFGGWLERWWVRGGGSCRARCWVLRQPAAGRGFLQVVQEVRVIDLVANRWWSRVPECGGLWGAGRRAEGLVGSSVA